MDEQRAKIDRLLSLFPLYSQDLGIDLTAPSGRFKWFLAALLFGARIGEQIAIKTYSCFKAADIDTPGRIIQAGWDQLVEILDAGGYVRYDFSTATKLLNIMNALKQNYGSLENLYHQASDEKDLERRLQEFKGIGPTTAQIFLRELRGIWEVKPKVSELAYTPATHLNIALDKFEGAMLARVETALVKLNLRYCKKRKYQSCPMADFCTEARSRVSIQKG